MKKRLIVILCLVVFAAAGAVSSTASNSGETKNVVKEGESNSADASANAASTASAEKEKSTEAEKTSTDTPTIEEQVLVDTEGIKITATGYTTDGFLGDGVKLVIENNTDTDYTIGCDALIVNDYMINDLFVSTVAAGKTANETVDLYSSELKAAGIENVGQIELYFHAYDDDFNYLFQKEYAVIETSCYDDMDTSADEDGTELYNENGIRIVGKTVDENSFWGTSILLYIENNSGKNVGISVNDMSVNGVMMDPLFSTTVYDGKKAVDSITLFESDLQDNDIESIDSAELKFNIYNADSYQTIVETDTISISAQ